MSDRDRFQYSQPAIDPTAFFNQVMIGNAFAFVNPNVFKVGRLSWLADLLACKPPDSPQIVSLLGKEPVEMLGLKIAPTDVGELKLQSITSDKAVYRAQKDTVNLLILNPLATTSVALSVRNGGMVFSQHKVELGKNGEGQLKLRDLPMGDFDVIFDGDTIPACQFVVAEYRLVPLVASLASSCAREDGMLDVKLDLQSFGVPVNDTINLNLLDRQSSIALVTAQANDGVVTASFKLWGEGPHTITAQLQSDPSKTASVPIRGSRKADRSQTVFSLLGSQIVGSLIPSAQATPVRGIYLCEGAVRSTPITLSRVDKGQAVLTVNEPMSTLKVIVVDPTFPRAQPSALGIKTSTSPYDRSDYNDLDPAYLEAATFLNAGSCEQACKLLERLRVSNPHPYHAYTAACCYAKLGRMDDAIRSLRQSIVDGWTDFAQMQANDELAALRGHPGFEALVTGGQKEITLTNLTASQTVVIDAFAPTSLVLIAGYVNGEPWEGWATLVAPSNISPRVIVRDDWTPGEEISIDIETEDDATSIFALVKDARMISTETPELRLASAIKTYVEGAGNKLSVGNVTLTMATIASRLQYNLPQRPASSLMAGSPRGSSLMGQLVRQRQGAPSAPPPQPQAAPPALSRAGNNGEPDTSRSDISRFDTGRDPRGYFKCSPSRSALPASFASTGDKITGDMNSLDVGGRTSERIDRSDNDATIVQPRSTTATATMVKPNSAANSCAEPEVLYAGFVPCKNGKATLTLKLPDVFADYIVECFAISGMNWAAQEVQFTARKDPFIQLTTPVFARHGEPCLGFVHVGTAASASVKVLCDGQPVDLFDAQGKQWSGEISGPPVTLTFQAQPGNYEAILEKNGIVVAHQGKQVDEPGKLKRIVRSLKILRSHETIALKDNATMRGLGLLPSIQRSFDCLVDATADYGHACCEQTAAKILSACAMYMVAIEAGDDDRRRKAESIIIAGIRREQSMWLPGQGFKMYPERENIADRNYGPRAARYLWNLQLIKAGNQISQDLSGAIEEGLAMASEATEAYQQPWPPRDIRSCEDAYNVLSFAPAGSADQAVSYVRNAMKEKSDLASIGGDPYLGQKVFARKESAYAAATLLRSTVVDDQAKALQLANLVISEFNEQGRLYSTCDSVAAIALMSELRSAHITTGDGMVEMNGKAMTVTEAMKTKEIVESIKVLEGVVTVAVEQMVEEDWHQFSSSVPVKVSIEKGGRHSRTFKAGDAIDLVVTLEEGYVVGDLLWIALPDAISRVVGGAQVKLFSVDFAGQNELRIALAATGHTEALCGHRQGVLDERPHQQSLAVCVRNMFQEERCGSPGLIAITVNR